MAEEQRRFAWRRSTEPSIYAPLLEKVKEMKRLGPPTKETAQILEGMENRAKTYHKFWVRNQRKVRGLMRNGIGWHIHAVVITIASAITVVKGSEVADKWIKYQKSGRVED